MAFLATAALAAGAVGMVPTGVQAKEQGSVRFATFNASLNRTAAGELADNLSQPYDGSDPSVSDEVLRRWQIANVAEVVQRTRPDVLLINEFDFDPSGDSIDFFRDNYLAVGQNGARPIDYPHAFMAPSNTGVPSGLDLDNSGGVGGPGDAYGFGFYEGQYGMLVLSRFPIDMDEVRTFQNFLWKDMPDNLLPTSFYDADEVDAFRLSSKSHWDLPIQIHGETTHFLVSHPTPPVFDGPEDRNGTRNHDEIRFWADYVAGGGTGDYIYDDAGTSGGLRVGKRFVIAGDQNADPNDGDSTGDAILQLLDHPRIRDPKPSSTGGNRASQQQGRFNETHVSPARLDTADFNDAGPGNLRADYVLPAGFIPVADARVYWPRPNQSTSRLTGAFDFGQFLRDGIGFPTSDHRLVYVDLTLI